MSLNIESRFDAYCDELVKALTHADRNQPAHPENMRSVHQSMHHLIAQAEWSDEALLFTVAGLALPSLPRGGRLLLDNRRHEFSEERNPLGWRGAAILRTRLTIAASRLACNWRRR